MPTLFSPAKINLFLEVTGRRADGYHDIESVFLAVDVGDTLRADKRPDSRVVLSCDRPDIPVDGRNLVVRAAELLRRECGIREGIDFALEKRIPAGAGLGGGSSNAAAALILADAVWKTGLSRAELAELGARVGSDVPFFLHGGLCLCRGRGERVTPLDGIAGVPRIALAATGLFSDTASAYRGLRLPPPGLARDAGRFIRALESGDPGAMSAAAFNRFEETVFRAFPELGAAHARLQGALDAPVRMSGSGSSLWLFDPRGDAAGRSPLPLVSTRALAFDSRATAADAERAGRMEAAPDANESTCIG